MADRPLVLWEDGLLDQPTAESKSARNLAHMYEAHGGRFEMGVRVYLQDGSRSIRLFGPVEVHARMGEGYQGNVSVESRAGLRLLELLEED
jgi:hypothetical protein